MKELALGPIIGGLSHDRAHIWGKASDVMDENTINPPRLHAWLGTKPDLSDAKLLGTSLPLTEETGYAGVAPVANLKANTKYHYYLSLKGTPPTPTDVDYPEFTSFPLPDERTSFAFAFGSCFRPEDQSGGRIFRALDQHREADNLRFILMIGDNIYADAFDHNGIGKIACTLEEYRAVYQYTWSRPDLRHLLLNLPVFMTLDDHEVDDDWRWTDRGRQQAFIPWWDKIQRRIKRRPLIEREIPLKRVQDALQAYWEHQGMHAPPFHLPPRLNANGQYDLVPGDPGSLAYSFNFGAVAFFILDTRSMRIRNRRERIMLGEGQWQALESWLRAVKDRFPVKFLVSSCSMLYPMWLDIPEDRWAGFSIERDRLIHFLADEGIEGVYLLTGDLHTAHAVRTDISSPDGRDISLWEFCSSPFEQQPSKFTKYTYLPLRGGPIKKSERVFWIPQNNYGIVRVDFPEEGAPRVRFELYGRNGDLLAKV